MKASIKYYQYSKSSWGKRRGALIFRQIKNLQSEKILKLDNLNIIELGCGVCTVSKKFITKNNKIIAVDKNLEMLVLVKNSRINLVNYDVLDFLKKNKKKFDLIICNNIIEYITDKERFMGLLNKAVKKNSILSLVVINLNYEVLKRFRNNEWRAGISLLRTRKYYSNNFKCSFNLKSIEEWKIFLNRFGWKIVNWHGVGLIDSDLYKDSHKGMDYELELLKKSPYRDQAVLTHFVCKIM
ncbi:MAG: methyltransferase domain-containing protein [Candidatus Buchananbacteria bacterium]